MLKPTDKAATLLRIAAYLGGSQKLITVSNARAKMRRTLALAAKGSVVLTTHGKPEAALVRFSTFEDLRRVLVHSLVMEMDVSFERSRERLQSQRRISQASSESDIERLVGEALKKTQQ